jgi:hypothetical protein
MLGITREQLADASGVPSRTIADFELQNTAARATTAAKLRTALEAAGVVFVDQNGGGPGVRLRDRQPGA